MKNSILLCICLLFEINVNAQIPKNQKQFNQKTQLIQTNIQYPLTPQIINVSKLPKLNLCTKTLPFFTNIFNYIKDKATGCGGFFCRKQFQFQITVINTKTNSGSYSSDIVDSSKTYYGTSSIEYEQPDKINYLPSIIELQGQFLISDVGLTDCIPCKKTDETFPWNSCSQPFGNNVKTGFKISINTCDDGSINPYRLTLKIDGVGTFVFNYQTIGNSTIYAINGQQIITITIGHNNFCDPC